MDTRRNADIVPKMHAPEFKAAMHSLGYRHSHKPDCIAFAACLGLHFRSIQKYIYGEAEIQPPMAILVRTWVAHPELMEGMDGVQKLLPKNASAPRGRRRSV